VGGGIRDPERAWRATSPAYGIKWAAVAGLLWLLMGLVVPFYVAVAWAVVGAGWVVLAVREALGGRGLRPLGFSTGPLTGTGARKSAEEGAVRGASQNPKGLSAAEPLLLFARGLPWGRAALAGIAVVISAPIVVYSGWRFMSHPVYWAWGAQNQILSPHPLHYVAAYGVPLALAAFAVGDAWRSKRPAWLALAWVGVVPLLVYLPFNLQRRLVEGVQVPLSLLAAKGLARITNYKLQITNHKRQTPIHKSEIPKSKSKTPRLKGQMPTAKSQSLRPDRSSSGRDGSRDASESGGFDNPPGAPEERPSGNPLRASLGRARLVVSVVVVALVASNAMLVAGNTMALRGRPSPIFRDAGEVAALDWLSQQVEPDDVVLASYETGNYLPARVGARAFVGHGPESVDAAEKKALVTKFFDGATEDSWREELLREYGVDAVFWGPAERELGGFEPHGAYYLRQVYEAEGYAVFAVDR
ncbi:MAG: hypothetical protein U9R72_17310, partial [Chloroflexota bacterium]|nr:hypothetical protein [Chloroflexota bacterium]